MASKAANTKNPTSKIDAAAEKAYAEAAAAKTIQSANPAAKKNAAPKIDQPKTGHEASKAPPAPAAAPAAKKPATKKVVKKAAPAKAVAAKPVSKSAARKAAPRKAAAKKAVKPSKAAKSAARSKETIMTKAQKTDFTAKAKEMAAKTGELAGEMNTFSKGNAEAVLESGKIWLAGVQEMGRDGLETGKTVVSTVTADAKKFAAVKSPTELVQLQGELARRNLDAAIAYSSNRTEAWIKLTTDAFAPIQSRISLAAEKLTKKAA